MEPAPPFLPGKEPTQFGASRSRLQDLGLLELEPPKKVAAPQHCLEDTLGCSHGDILPSWDSNLVSLVLMGVFIFHLAVQIQAIS